jgi:hypothetical protein
MAEILNATQSICVAELRLKDDGRAQGIYQATLPWNTEFGREVAFHPGDYLNCHILHGSHPFVNHALIIQEVFEKLKNNKSGCMMQPLMYPWD